MEKPDAEKIDKSCFPRTQASLKEVFGNNHEAQPVLAGRADGSSDKKYSLTEAAINELFLAALEIVEATEKQVELVTRSEVNREEFLEGCTQLLAIYDEYLQLLEDELAASAQAIDSGHDVDHRVREELIRLHASIEQNGAVLVGVYGFFWELQSGDDLQPPAGSGALPV